MLDDLKKLFKGNNFTGQIILINAGAFLLVNIVAALAYGGVDRPILNWLGMPSFIPTFVTRPWTVFTYMFMHGGLWHLIFNMYMLYWFGRIFADFLGQKRLAGLYFMGGLAGGLLYLISYNLIFLGGDEVQGAILVGASAAVMAVTIASGIRFPDYTINLMFIGPVKLKYVALVVFLLSTVIDFQSNMGGKIAHIGGAAAGYFYARGLNNGKDHALSFVDFFMSIGSWFDRGPKLKVVKDKPGQKSSRSKAAKATATKKAGGEHTARVDEILDKISKSGYENLSKEEKEFLFNLNNKK